MSDPDQRIVTVSVRMTAGDLDTLKRHIDLDTAGGCRCVEILDVLVEGLSHRVRKTRQLERDRADARRSEDRFYRQQQKADQNS